MPGERILIIIHDKFLLNFLLLESSKAGIKTIASKGVRVYRRVHDFSIVEYILQALSCWGREIGICLVKQMIPLIGQEGKDGVDDIFIFTYRAYESLLAITKNIFVFGKDICQEGALNITKFVDLKSLLFVSLGTDETLIARYMKNDKGVLKVVSERKDFKMGKYAKAEAFLESLGDFSLEIKPGKAVDIIKNNVDFPVFNLKSQQEVLIEYLINGQRLEVFKKCKKLNFKTFGDADFKREILVVGGDRARFIDNMPFELLSILSVFNLSSNFDVYVDRFGLFEFLQKSKKQILSDKVYDKLLLEFWGKCMVIKRKKRPKLDEIVADVDVLDGNSERQIIPMFGRITKFTFLDKGSINLQTRKGFSIAKDTICCEVKDASKNFVIDARGRPIEDIYKQRKKSELVHSWLKGMEALD